MTDRPETTDLTRLVNEAEHAHTRAEAGVRAATAGIEAAMDRLAHLGRVAAIARAVRAEAERDRLREFLETCGGEPADAEILRLRAELADARAVGRCDATADGGLTDPQHCILPAGHPGWHKDATGETEWAPTPIHVEYAIEVLEDDGTWGWTLTDSQQMLTPAGVIEAIEGIRARNPEYQYRAVTRALPPFRPVSDEQLATMADRLVPWLRDGVRDDAPATAPAPTPAGQTSPPGSPP